MSYKHAYAVIPTYQVPAILAQANAVKNTWYTVLDTQRNVRIYDLASTTDAADTVQIRITIDGQVFTLEQVQGAGTLYSWNFLKFVSGIALANVSGSAINFTATYPNEAFQIEGRSIKIEARQTSDVTNTVTLTVGVIWAQY